MSRSKNPRIDVEPFRKYLQQRHAEGTTWWSLAKSWGYFRTNGDPDITTFKRTFGLAPYHDKYGRHEAKKHISPQNAERFLEMFDDLDPIDVGL